MHEMIIFNAFCRDKAKATAAALLKDESFIIKYPALARALKESVDDGTSPSTSQPIAASSSSSLPYSALEAGGPSGGPLGSLKGPLGDPAATENGTPFVTDAGSAGRAQQRFLQQSLEGGAASFEQQVAAHAHASFDNSFRTEKAGGMQEKDAAAAADGAAADAGAADAAAAAAAAPAEKAAAAAATDEADRSSSSSPPPGEKPLDPPLHYMKR